DPHVLRSANGALVVVPEATGAAHIETPAPVAGTTRGASQLPVHYRLIEVGIGPDTVGPRQDAQGIDSKTWAGQSGRPVGCCVHSPSPVWREAMAASA